MDSSRRPPKSIDGFMPRSLEDRHVGFTPAPRPRQSSSLPGVRVRQPGFHTQPHHVANTTGFTSRSSINRPVGQADHSQLPPVVPRQFAPPAEQTAKHKHKRGKHRIGWKKVAKRTALVFALFILLCGGWLGFKIFKDSSKVFGGNSSLLGFLSATTLKGENTGRVNILMAGNSVDDPSHQGASLTDSIMLISINVKNNTAYMMSIPRDLYVNIPGFGYGKINQAYPEGQSENFNQPGYAKGGMGLLEEVVSQDFGIPIDYYGLVDYTAFRDAVNAVGGVTVDIQSPDPRGLYDSFTNLKLPNGWVHLNGQQALNLARARGDNGSGDISYGFPSSDFDRTQHQRELLLALKQKVFTTGVLANPIKLGEVFDAIGNNVHTDLTAGNVRRLYDIFHNIKSTDIKSYGLNNVTFQGQNNVDLLQDYNVGSEEALAPSAGLNNYNQIQLFMQGINTNNPVLKENANVVVLNAGSTSGLATAEAKLLNKKGISVSAVGNAPGQTSTSIINNSGGKDPATLAALEATYGDNTTTSATLTAQYPQAQFIVILGSSLPMP